MVKFEQTLGKIKNEHTAVFTAKRSMSPETRILTYQNTMWNRRHVASKECLCRVW